MPLAMLRCAARTQMSTEPIDPADAVDLVAALVLAYLDEHPHAADSLDGVARWWVGDDGRFGAAAVECALDRLVSTGRLRRQTMADGSRLYAVAHQREGPTAPRSSSHMH